jgi:hypothetical protein
MWHQNTNKDTLVSVGGQYMNFGKMRMNVFKKHSQQEQTMKVFDRQLRNFTSAYFFFLFFPLR